MPRIPRSNRAEALDYTIPPVQGAGAGLAIVGNHLERARDVLFSVDQARKQARREIELNNSLLTYTQSMNNLDVATSSVQDPEAMRDAWNERADEILTETRDGIADPLAQREFEQRALRNHEERRIQMEASVTKQYASMGRASVTARVEQLKREAAAAGDPAVRQQKVDEAAETILRGASFFDPETTEKNLRGLASDVDTETARSLIREDPETALAVLLDKRQLQGLDPIARESQTKIAQAQVEMRDRRYIAAVEASDRRADRAQKQREEATFKDRYIKARSGGYGEADLAADASDLGVEHIKALGRTIKDSDRLTEAEADAVKSLRAGLGVGPFEVVPDRASVQKRQDDAVAAFEDWAAEEPRTLDEIRDYKDALLGVYSPVGRALTGRLPDAPRGADAGMLASALVPGADTAKARASLSDASKKLRDGLASGNPTPEDQMQADAIAEWLSLLSQPVVK